MRKIQNFDSISCQKMREYREITPENDPCKYALSQIVNRKKTSTVILSDSDVLTVYTGSTTQWGVPRIYKWALNQ